MGMISKAFVFALVFSSAIGATAAELRWAIASDPKSFDPLLAAEEPSETVRYLTGGVLIRLNRTTQQLEPELATSWKITDGGKRVDFQLRSGVMFSDGSRFGPTDVVSTIERIMDPKLASAVADTFRGGGAVLKAQSAGANQVTLTLSQPITGVEFLFDQLTISRAGAASDGRTGLGPFVVDEHKSGQYVKLRRNPHYWKKDAKGQQLPYAESVRLDIQANREAELLRFRKGELHLIQGVEPDAFERLRKESPRAAIDSGASLDSEFMWFNQVPTSPIAAYKKDWFQSKRFRNAISSAINRNDMVRLVYRGFGAPAGGLVSPSNRFWYNKNLKAPSYDAAAALRSLEQDGFRREQGTLKDRNGNIVEFSVITNAGSKVRLQLGAMLQEDLAKLGIRVNIVPLEFRSLIERIQKTADYEACILGFTNVELDPNAQLNVLASSGTHHPWYPRQPKPATPWEAEIDARMREQASAADRNARKKAFDRVQEILAEQSPIIHFVHPNVLSAVSPSLRNVSPSVLPPHIYWNAERLAVGAATER